MKLSTRVSKHPQTCGIQVVWDGGVVGNPLLCVEDLESLLRVPTALILDSLVGICASNEGNITRNIERPVFVAPPGSLARDPWELGKNAPR